MHVLQLHYMDQSESLYVKQVKHSGFVQWQYSHPHPEKNQHQLKRINMLLQLVRTAQQFQQD
ncbi:hypothetical protein D3C80_711930 [compost metagenome]